MAYFLTFLLSFILAIIITPLIIKLAKKGKILDQPTAPRKIHKQPKPLLGGLAVYFSFVIVIIIIILSYKSDLLFGGYLLPKHVLGFLLGGLVLMIGGYIDDKYNLKPKQQIVFPLIASGIIIASGIGIEYIRTPFGALELNGLQLELFSLNGVPYQIALWSDLFTVVWLMVLMYTTKFLDGLDGLVSGITVISSFVLFLLSISEEVAQPETALLAIILAGAVAGFLLYNFNPAKIFLGESGSTFLGFALAVIAIISGGKIATALLLLGLPVLDVIWVILQRLVNKRKITSADKAHLHFRLLDIGLSQRKIVLILYALTAVFGASALYVSGENKIFALFAVLIMMLIIISGMTFYSFKIKNKADQ
ncbi:MAG: MraY family glycosyltransferase [bacterium]